MNASVEDMPKEENSGQIFFTHPPNDSRASIRHNKSPSASPSPVSFSRSPIYDHFAIQRSVSSMHCPIGPYRFPQQQRVLGDVYRAIWGSSPVWNTKRIALEAKQRMRRIRLYECCAEASDMWWKLPMSCWKLLCVTATAGTRLTLKAFAKAKKHTSSSVFGTSRIFQRGTAMP